MEKPLMLTIKNTYKLWADYMKILARDAGVPESYSSVLTFLLRNPGASQKDIAEHRGITTASVSQVVKEMELTGYLVKEQDEKDGRYVKLCLTEKGEEAARRVRENINRADERISALLTKEKEDELFSLLHALSDIIGKELPKC